MQVGDEPQGFWRQDPAQSPGTAASTLTSSTPARVAIDMVNLPDDLSCEEQTPH